MTIPWSTSARKILILEDEPGERLLLSTLCQREGFETVLTTSVLEAVAAAQVCFPDAAIMDIMLDSEENGYDAARALRAMAGERRLPIIFVSLLRGTDPRVEAIRVGSDAFFEKPFDWAALMRELRALLDEAPGGGGRILVVEDDPDQALIYERLLIDASFEVMTCTDPRLFEQALEEFAPELVLLDVNLPHYSGYELARMLRQERRFATLPIIFMTAEQSLSAELESIAAGGDDHLRKPIDPSLLVSSVQSRLERARRVQTLVERDSLTSLLTRRAFESHATSLMARKHRLQSHDAVVAMIDIDHFKAVNDNYGHAVGDEVLRKLASHIDHGLRTTDIVGRYGGEELIALLDQTTENNARAVLEKLLEEFREIAFASDGSLQVTFSAGVAALDLGETLAEWTARADHALYSAKIAGRARVISFGTLKEAALDPKVLDSLRELGNRGNVDLLGEIVEIFRRVAPQRVATIRSAAARKKFGQLVSTAHSLRSAAANIGALQLAEVCGALEREARLGSIATLTALLPTVEQEYLRSLEALLALEQQETVS